MQDECLRVLHRADWVTGQELLLFDLDDSIQPKCCHSQKNKANKNKGAPYLP
jgi:hypothetical protein